MKAHRFQHVMSLLPLDPLLPGRCPGTPRYASASLKAGFARLPETRKPEPLRVSGPMKTLNFKSTVTPVSEKAGRVTCRSNRLAVLLGMRNRSHGALRA